MNLLIKKAIEVVGSQRELADLIGVGPVFVSQMKNGKRSVPAELCPKIEVATRGQVTRADLRPELFGELDMGQAA